MCQADKLEAEIATIGEYWQSPEINKLEEQSNKKQQYELYSLFMRPNILDRLENMVVMRERNALYWRQFYIYLEM